MKDKEGRSSSRQEEPGRGEGEARTGRGESQVTGQLQGPARPVGVPGKDCLSEESRFRQKWGDKHLKADERCSSLGAISHSHHSTFS